MLNNLTIFLVITTLFVYFGGKNVPKELVKYKLLIVGLTIGLIVCSFVKGNVEHFEVKNRNTVIYGCDDNESDETSPNYCSTFNCKHSVHSYLDDLSNTLNLGTVPTPGQTDTRTPSQIAVQRRINNLSINLNNQCQVAGANIANNFTPGSAADWERKRAIARRSSNSGEPESDSSESQESNEERLNDPCFNPQDLQKDGLCRSCKSKLGSNNPKVISYDDSNNDYKCLRCPSSPTHPSDPEVNDNRMQWYWQDTDCPRPLSNASNFNEASRYFSQENINIDLEE